MPADDSSPSNRSSAARSSSEDDRIRAVHVRFPPSQAQRLQRPEPDTCGDGRPLWTERPLLLQRANGTFELIGTTDNLPGLARWILSYGADAEVKGPDRLRRRLAAEAHRIWQMYADD